MATHDYVIANGTGAAVRSDLNNALAAIVSNNSGSSEPGTTYAYQWWADTNANVLKIRNSANNAWITLRELDGTMLIEDGSAASPGLAFADDLNTGIYSGANNQIGFTTDGVERFKITTAEAVFNDESNDIDFRVESNGNTHMLFVDAANDRVGIGESGTLDGLLVIKGDSNASTVPSIRLKDGTDTREAWISNASGDLVLVNGGDDNTPHCKITLFDANILSFETANTERLRLDSSGRLLVGASSSSADCAGVYEGSSSSAAAIVHLSRSSGVSNGSTLGALDFSDNAQNTYAQIKAAADAEPSGSSTPGRITFSVCPNGTTTLSEAARIDEGGRFMVGVSSNFVRGQIQAVDSGGGEITIGRNDTTISNGDDIGHLFYCSNDAGTAGLVVANISCFADADHSSGSAAASLRFNVVEGGSTGTTERMRLDNGGQLIIFTTGNPITAGTSQGAGTSFDILTGLHSRSNVSSGGTISVRIYSNGNIQNTNNSYGQLSDVKLKENIVNANSQWDDIKGVRVRNFNFKEETGNPTHTQIGVVAQELETVSPGLVYETPDRDAEGNDLGTATKAVNYSVLYMKAVKALQEAMDRIETLEAKVAALEAG